MPSITTQAELDSALSDFNTAASTASAAMTAVWTVQLPATPYAAEVIEAAQIQSAESDREVLVSQLAGLPGRAAALAALIRPLLPA